MDKLPVTPSPHRFLLPKIKNKPKTKAGPLQHHTRHLSVPKNSGEASNTLPASSTLEPYALDPRARAQKIQSATATELGGRSKDGLRVDDAESLVAWEGDGLNAGPMGGHSEGAETHALNAVSDGIWKEARTPNTGGRLAMLAMKETQMPRGGQFKAAPRFRFGSSQRPRKGPPSEVESGLTAVSYPTQPICRATQTPLRQSIRREVREEEIVDVEGDMLMEVVREPVKWGEMDVALDLDAEEYGDITYSKFYVEGPAAKRRRVGADPVESFYNSQTEQNDATTGYEGQQELQDGLYDDRDGRNYDDHVDHNETDEEMLDTDHREDRNLSAPEDLSHSIPSSRQSGRQVPTPFQRPRFIQPSSHPLPPSTPQTFSAQQKFAPKPQFVITTPHQAPSHHENEQHATHRTFAPTPNFLITTPLHPSTVKDEPQFIKPPKFVHIEEPEPTQPLPEEFSPRKRGQNFVVGGVANEVRGWLVDFESQNQGSNLRATRQEESYKEGGVVQVVVDEVRAGKGFGWTIAKGSGINVILGGEGSGEELEKGKNLQKGAVVNIKAPVWEVEVEGSRWSIAANWRA